MIVMASVTFTKLRCNKPLKSPDQVALYFNGIQEQNKLWEGTLSTGQHVNFNKTRYYQSQAKVLLLVSDASLDLTIDIGFLNVDPDGTTVFKDDLRDVSYTLSSTSMGSSARTFQLKTNLEIETQSTFMIEGQGEQQSISLVEQITSIKEQNPSAEEQIMPETDRDTH